jgi:F-type H+-transporting ATPase subunit gamma
LSFIASEITLLPLKKSDEEANSLMEFEPNVNVVINEMLDIYIPTMLKGCLKEAEASEQTSRRTAMESATKNGKELLEDLNKEYNKTRQAKITQEISEISAGSESLK